MSIQEAESERRFILTAERADEYIVALEAMLEYAEHANPPDTEYSKEIKELIRMFGTKDLPAVLPCPFCAGAKIELRKDKDFYWCWCEDCTGSGPLEEDEMEAIAQWNKRSDNECVASRKA